MCVYVFPCLTTISHVWFEWYPSQSVVSNVTYSNDMIGELFGLGVLGKEDEVWTLDSSIDNIMLS